MTEVLRTWGANKSERSKTNLKSESGLELLELSYICVCVFVCACLRYPKLDICALSPILSTFVTDSKHYGKGTPNDEYENFVNAHIEAAAKCIPTKPRTKTWKQPPKAIERTQQMPEN